MNERDPEDEALIAASYKKFDMLISGPVDSLRVVKVMNQDGSHYGWTFDCPGCDRSHMVTTGWAFNGDEVRPTFSPSVLVQGVEDITDDAHDRIMAGEKIATRPYVCHSFVADGRIQYLGDCTHAMAGTTVDLPAVDVRRSTPSRTIDSDPCR